MPDDFDFIRLLAIERKIDEVKERVSTLEQTQAVNDAINDRADKIEATGRRNFVAILVAIVGSVAGPIVTYLLVKGHP